VLTYEALHADPVFEFRRLLRFLGEPVDDAALRQAVDAASFDAMQRSEAQTQVPNIAYDYSNHDARRVRKGVVGGYRDEMPIELFDAVADYLDHNLTPEAKKLVADHGMMQFDYGHA
jgi:hypothetical protein